MRVMLKFTIPTTEESNTSIRDGSIGQTMETILGKLQPEAAYFCPIDGKEAGIPFSVWRKILHFRSNSVVHTLIHPASGKTPAC
jgi:hypothetical protein